MIGNESSKENFEFYNGHGTTHQNKITKKVWSSKGSEKLTAQQYVTKAISRKIGTLNKIQGNGNRKQKC